MENHYKFHTAILLGYTLQTGYIDQHDILCLPTLYKSLLPPTHTDTSRLQKPQQSSWGSFDQDLHSW